MNKIDFCKNWEFKGRTIQVPHDAMLEEGRSPDSPGGSAVGFFKGCQAVYTKKFRKPDEEHVFFFFEGVYKNAKVEINGHPAGECAYGYSSFCIEADSYLKNGDNKITVTADNCDLPNSRWYSGTGIYRPVWMLTGGQSYIQPGSIRVTTKGLSPATIQVKADIFGMFDEINVEIWDGNQLVASGSMGDMEIPDAILWNEEHPHLYHCIIRIIKDKTIIDTAETSFGIRILSMNENGFYVNGEKTLLRGGCIHHDNGILGACAYKEAEWRKVRMLKEAGFNALRSAHNPCSSALLDACDYYGIYVMDESWDMWFQRKNKYDYALAFEENWQYDLKNMVEKDYNHPCVLFYSIGNEVSEPASDKGLALAKEMTDYLHELDRTRYVTGGFNLMLLGRAAKGMFQYSEETPDTTPLNSSMIFNKMASMIGTGMNKASGSKEIDELISPLMDCIDIAGYNYASGRYEKDAKLHPKRLIIGTETFPQDIVKNWEMVKKLPNLIGDFMWTAWDYLGEAGIGAWAYTTDGRSFNKPYPWFLGDVGVFDILGNPNGEIYQARAAWNLLKIPAVCVQPVNHLGVKPAKQTWRGTNSIPSWSFKGCEKNPAVVEVYASPDAAKAVLICNGKKVGKKNLKSCKAVFKMRYQPGKLEAVVYDKKKNELGRCTLTSAADAVPTVHSEKNTAAPEEIVFLSIIMEDQNGTIESNDDRALRLTVENGELLGFGSANPRTEEDFLTNSSATYYGRAMAAVRAGKKGTLKVTVSDGSAVSIAQIKIREEIIDHERYPESNR